MSAIPDDAKAFVLREALYDTAQMANMSRIHFVADVSDAEGVRSFDPAKEHARIASGHPQGWRCFLDDRRSNRVGGCGRRPQIRRRAARPSARCRSCDARALRPVRDYASQQRDERARSPGTHHGQFVFLARSRASCSSR
jgi:hypothetical protein